MNFLSIFKKKSPQEEKIVRFVYENFHIKPKNFIHYKNATTHSSVHEKNNLYVGFERYEFLGDGVLDLIIREILFKKFAYENEGKLTQLKSKMVSRKTLSEWAKSINIKSILKANYLGMNREEFIFGNALEALIGAIYLDYGYKKTSLAMEYFLENKLRYTYDMEDTNYKGLLIEWAQKNKTQWNYTTHYSPNEKAFISTLTINNIAKGTGKGNSKRDAEQEAAKSALQNLNNNNPDN